MNWYALTVPPQKEFAAEAGLKARGHQVFVPHEYKWRRVSRYAKRRARKAYPLMVRYIFIGFEGSPPWHVIDGIEGVHGVARLLCFNGRPAQIPRDDVEYLRTLCGENAPQSQAPNPHKGLKPGDAAQIVAGPLQGQVVQIANLDAKRAQAIFTMLGSMRTIEIPLASLEAA